MAVAVLYVMQALLFLTLGPLRGEEYESGVPAQRPLGEIVRQPVFIVAVLGGVCAYGVMTLIMTATPLSMHINDGFDIEQTANVIRSHVLAMYVPSMFSGYLMDKLGTIRMMAIGAFALVAASGVALQGHALMHYWWALVLLGIGWNFLYVGGTTMLTLTYTMPERFNAQAVNEFAVFGMSAAGSLLAGTVIYYYSWSTLVTIPLVPLVIILVGLFIVRRDSLVARLSPHGA
jgi:MFS family permease